MKNKNNTISVATLFRQDRKFLLKYSGLFATAIGLVGAIGGMAYVGAQIQDKHLRNTTVLNALGTEKALSQQISKNILLLQREWRDGARINTTELGELVAGRSRFEAILNGLKGAAPIAEAPTLGEQYAIELDKLAKAFAPMGAQIDILGQAGAILAKNKGDLSERDTWLAGRKAFSLTTVSGRANDVPNAFINSPSAFKPTLSANSEAAAAVSEQVTKTANVFNSYAGDLLAATGALNAHVNAEIGALEESDSLLQQRIGYVGAAMFLLMLAYFIRKNILADYLINKSDRERVAILQNLGEGLFLMNAGGEVESQVSEYAKKIFGETFGPGSNVLDALRSSIDPDSIDAAKQYVALLCDSKRRNLKAHAIRKINPLNQITISGPLGAMHVGFNFSKIQDESGRVTSLLVSVIDSTGEVRLKDELGKEIERNSAQFKLLSELATAANRAEILALVVDIIEWVEISNASIANKGANGLEFLRVVKTLQRDAHTFKNRAGEQGLSPISHFMHDLETTMIAATKTGAVNADKLLEVPNRFKDILKALSVYRSILLPHGAIGGNAPAKPVFAQIESAAMDQAERSGKQVKFTASGVEPEKCLDEAMLRALRDALLHVAKNSVVHGIETTQERQAAAKNAVGKVALLGRIEDGFFKCSLLDDGRGIDTETVRRKLGDIPAWKVKAATMSRRELLNAVFIDGVSTRDIIDHDSGRGIGLAACKEFIENAGGAVEVTSSDGKGCAFDIKMPVAH